MLSMNIDRVPKIKLFGFISYKSPWLHFKRNTDEYILYFIKSGELHLRENGVPYILKKGDFLMLEPNMDHEGTKSHICDYYYVHFTHSEIARMNSHDFSTLAKRMILEDNSVMQTTENGDADEYHVCYFPKYFRINNQNSFLHMVHAMNDMIQLYKRKNYNRSLTALKFGELLIEASREHFLEELQKSSLNNSKSYVKVHELLSYLHQNYQQKISSSDIEAEFECNFDYLNRTFSKLTGHTIIRYLNLIRINHAKELIEATHMNLSEIGYLVGLNDPYYFSKVFKKYVGLSPMQYYKKIRETD